MVRLPRLSRPGVKLSGCSARYDLQILGEDVAISGPAPNLNFKGLRRTVARVLGAVGRHALRESQAEPGPGHEPT